MCNQSGHQQAHTLSDVFSKVCDESAGINVEPDGGALRRDTHCPDPLDTIQGRSRVEWGVALGILHIE